MQALARSAAAALRRSSASAASSASAGTRRSMSSGVSLEEEKKQMDLWRVITIVGEEKLRKRSRKRATTSHDFFFHLRFLFPSHRYRVLLSSLSRGPFESLRDALCDGEEKENIRTRHVFRKRTTRNDQLAPSFFSPFSTLHPFFSLFRQKLSTPSSEKKNKKTKKTSLFSAIPACLAFTFYTVSNEEHHAGEKPERTYTNVRSKPFPWGEDALFTKKGGHH